MAANSFLRMLFGQGTEPSYGGLRVPRQRVEDDSQFIRIGNPQERFRDYHDDRSGYNTVDTSQIDEMSRVEGGNRLVQSEEDKAKAKKKMQGLISGIGGDLAQMFAQHQEPTKPLQFAQLQQQQMIPLIDPRFMRYGGGRKRGGRVEPGTFVDVHDDEKVVNTGDDVIVVPKKEVKTLEAMLGNKVLPREPEAIPSFEQFQESRKTAEQPITFPEEVTATEQVTPDSVTETVTEQEPSIADLLRAKIDERQQRLAEGATKNADGTTTYGGKVHRKRNWKDALKSAGLGMLQSLASAPPTNDLGSLLGRAIGGAGAGGVMGATMNNVDERMVDKMKLAQLVPQYKQAAEMEKQKRDAEYRNVQIDELRGRPAQKLREIEARGQQAIARINRNADVKAGIAKPVINEGGYIELEYLNADSTGKRRDNELLKGADGQPIFVPGEQGLTWIDPLTKKPMQVKAKQTLMPGATIATGNAVRQTAADKDNAEKYWQTQKTNIENQMKYMSDIKGLLTAAITAESGMVDDPGTRAEMDGKLNEITVLSNSSLPKTNDPSKAQEDRVKRVNKLVDDYNTLNNKLLDNLSKSATGKAKADQIRAQIASMKRPEKLTYTPYQPTMVTGGISGSVVNEGVFIERLKANGVTDPAEQKALINKARADGKIK